MSRSPFPPGRVLWLAEDAGLVRRQLAGEQVPLDTDGLANDVSTDEMAPGWACYYFDERLGRYCLMGLRGGVVSEGSIAAGGFDVLVGGHNFGCGSSRETAPYAQLVAGIQLVVAKSFARSYAQNSLNIGLSLSTDFDFLDRLVTWKSSNGQGPPCSIRHVVLASRPAPAFLLVHPR